MKIGPKHVFTSGPVMQKGATQRGKLHIDFHDRAHFRANASSLKGRVTLQKPTNADKKMTKLAHSIAREVPTPFIKK